MNLPGRARRAGALLFVIVEGILIQANFLQAN